MHHRYYLNKHTNHRIRGNNLEKVVFDAIHYVCLESDNLEQCFTGDYALLPHDEAMHRLQNLWSNWAGITEQKKCSIAQQLIDRITILPDSTVICIRYEQLNQMLKSLKTIPSQEPVATLDIVNSPSVTICDDHLKISLQVIFKVKDRSSQAFDNKNKAFEVFKTTNYNMTLINALAKSYKWDQMVKLKGYTPELIANENKLSKSYVSSMLRLTMLSPEITEDILSGHQPDHLQLKDLVRLFPYEWSAQKLHFSY